MLLVLVSFYVCSNTPSMETSCLLLQLACFFDLNKVYLPTLAPHRPFWMSSRRLARVDFQPLFSLAFRSAACRLPKTLTASDQGSSPIRRSSKYEDFELFSTSDAKMGRLAQQCRGELSHETVDNLKQGKNTKTHSFFSVSTYF